MDKAYINMPVLASDTLSSSSDSLADTDIHASVCHILDADPRLGRESFSPSHEGIPHPRIQLRGAIGNVFQYIYCERGHVTNMCNPVGAHTSNRCDERVVLESW